MTPAGGDRKGRVKKCIPVYRISEEELRGLLDFAEKNKDKLREIPDEYKLYYFPSVYEFTGFVFLFGYDILPLLRSLIDGKISVEGARKYLECSPTIQSLDVDLSTVLLWLRRDYERHNWKELLTTVYESLTLTATYEKEKKRRRNITITVQVVRPYHIFVTANDLMRYFLANCGLINLFYDYNKEKNEFLFRKDVVSGEYSQSFKKASLEYNARIIYADLDYAKGFTEESSFDTIGRTKEEVRDEVFRWINTVITKHFRLKYALPPEAISYGYTCLEEWSEE